VTGADKVGSSVSVAVGTGVSVYLFHQFVKYPFPAVFSFSGDIACLIVDMCCVFPPLYLL
jgi:hypothetical protein